MLHVLIQVLLAQEKYFLQGWYVKEHDNSNVIHVRNLVHKKRKVKYT